MKAYNVFDSAAKAYTLPNFMSTNGLAVRAFTEAVNNKETPMGQYPADYTMFCIGEYDEQTGQLIPYETCEKIGNGLEFLADPTPQQNAELQNNQELRHIERNFEMTNGKYPTLAQLEQRHGGK